MRGFESAGDSRVVPGFRTVSWAVTGSPGRPLRVPGVEKPGHGVTKLIVQISNENVYPVPQLLGRGETMVIPYSRCIKGRRDSSLV